MKLVRGENGAVAYTFLDNNHTFQDRGSLRPFKLEDPHANTEYLCGYLVGVETMGKSVKEDLEKVGISPSQSPNLEA